MPTIDDMARVCHEANRVWCEFNGDHSQEHWEFASEHQRFSCRAGVQFIIGNPQAGESALHDNWMRDKLNAGWVYGPVKDENATPPTHPCLIPFSELPAPQQFKDQLFRTIVLSMLELS